ncbi:hypothetical protein H0H87_000417 [Tephrocybe sp. NHM501043]|nr:hypothetical protein H0H87_000417 [Tephrocybe sp. NHM501043]
MFSGHWGLSAPNSKEVRFTEHNDLAKFYQTAKEVGILVIVRPGPYINAESAGGGIPGWVTNLPSLARTNATDYRDAWYPYISEFAKQTTPYQYPDGPVIAIQSENEYFTTASKHIPGLDEHMQALIDTYRSNGLTKIPTIHNDKNAGAQFSTPGLGKVDLYGWDGYPLGFDCDNPSKWAELSTQFDTSHQRLNPAEPLAMFEWQGGAFSYWSGPGYSECYKLINEQFANAISEDRTLTPKLDELKLQSSFLHASPDYLLVGRIGNGTVGQGTAYSTSADIYTTHLNSPSTDANFYVVRQVTNVKITDTNFTLRVNTTSAGEITIPKSGSLTLAGRESKIIVSNYPFGSSRLQYSTAEIMTWATFDGVDTLVAYTLAGQTVEIVAENPNGSSVTTVGSRSIKATKSGKTVTVSGSPLDITVVTFGKTRIIVADKKTASAFWAPRLAEKGTGHDHYDLGPSVDSVLVKGPYLVRGATALSSTLQLTGDLNATTTIDIFAPKAFTGVTWNGKTVKVSKTDIGTLRGSVSLPADLRSVKVPVLNDLEWKCADSLPELSADYDDSTWVLANKTSTLRPQQPTAGKNVLYSSEYGFHAGQWVWRGHFNGSATGVQLSIQGGFSFGYSVFINSHFLGSGQGSSHSQDGVDILSPTFNFTDGQLVDGDNVLTVIHDSTGANQDYNIDDEFKTPRGIRGYILLSADGKDFTEWRLAGNVGGENAPDAVRGPYNEGGWWFERVGAHLPGYDDSKWVSCTPYEGVTAPGVAVYRTTFDLNLPKDADVPLAFDFELDNTSRHRVLIYVNGWQFGRFLSSLGPQTSFPVPEGILNHHGKNEGAKLAKLELNTRAVLATSKSSTLDIVAAPGWKELRGNVTTI